MDAFLYFLGRLVWVARAWVKKLRYNFYLKKYETIYIKNVLPQKNIKKIKNVCNTKFNLIRIRILIPIC